MLSPEFKPPFHGFGQTLILGSYDGALLLFRLKARRVSTSARKKEENKKKTHS